jgi:hypothetical protein
MLTGLAMKIGGIAASAALLGGAAGVTMANITAGPKGLHIVKVVRSFQIPTGRSAEAGCPKAEPYLISGGYKIEGSIKDAGDILTSAPSFPSGNAWVVTVGSAADVYIYALCSKLGMDIPDEQG